jgi:opacity protein-like surface antigen
MKKIILLLFAFFSFTAVNAQFSLGGGIGYATEIDNLNFHVDGNYAFNEQWEGAATFTYYLTGESAPGVDLSWYGFDFNAHFNFSEYTGGKIYALAGLNIMMVSVSFEDTTGMIGDFSTSDSDIGLNIGVGTKYALNDKLSLFGEAKYTIAGAKFFNLGAGVLFAL